MGDFKFSQVLAPRYRALLFDLAALLFNLVGLSVLAVGYTNLAALSLAGQAWAKVTVAGFYLLAAFLQPVGAVLKFHRTHERNPNLRPTAQAFLRGAGCLPIGVYFALQLTFLFIGAALLSEVPDPAELPSDLFGILFVGLPLLAGVNTLVVWLYFTAPVNLPVGPFLRSAPAEWAGDAFIALNLLLYQVLWWYFLADPSFSARPASVWGFLDKLLGFAGMVVFFYLPPRVFYWAEGVNWRATVLGALAANLPILLRVFFGVG
jgi:hypothetical protein